MAAQWLQDMVVKLMEETTTANKCPKPSLERKAMKPHKEQAPNCPRCNSTNTKFCYYNNYSLSQPRYLCRTCRRYWTEGGSLRNIPVGGGSRKSKRPYSSSSSAPPSKKLPDLVSPLIPQQNPKNIQDYPDLNSLDIKAINELIQVPSFQTSKELHDLSSNPSSASPHRQPSALELLNGIVATASRGLNSFTTMPFTSTTNPNPVNYSSGFSLPFLNFSSDGLGRSNYGSPQGVRGTGGMLLLPFQGLRQVSNSAVDAEQSKDQDGDSTAGYWNGVTGGGSW